MGKTIQIRKYKVPVIKDKVGDIIKMAITLEESGETYFDIEHEIDDPTQEEILNMATTTGKLNGQVDTMLKHTEFKDGEELECNYYLLYTVNN